MNMAALEERWYALGGLALWHPEHHYSITPETERWIGLLGVNAEGRQGQLWHTDRITEDLRLMTLEWAVSRVERFQEWGPEPDGWGLRSDGWYQLYIGTMDVPDL